MNKIHITIIWREFKRDINNIKLQLFILLAVGFADISFIKYPDAKYLYSLMPYSLFMILAFYMPYNDLNNCIESLLSLPISIKSIIIEKSIYIVLKNLVISLINVGMLTVIKMNSIQINNNDWEMFFLLHGFLLLFSVLIITIGWMIGAKYKLITMSIMMGINIGIFYFIFIADRYLSFLTFSMIIAFVVWRKLDNNITKELVIKRSV
jgi:hypothetical protein